jgi:hypothetical protein
MKKLLLVLSALLLLAFQSKASHIAACELTYSYISGNDYLITLTFYRDCSGVAEDATASINFNSSCGNFSVTLNKIAPVNGIEVTTVCPGQYTTCSGGTIFGVEKFVYQGQVTLTQCADWTMSYVMCCRNPSNTISNPTGASMYIPATLNNLVAPSNSSPAFSNSPSFIICNGQQTCFNLGAIDPDGDSLVYTLVTPYDAGPLSYVTYLGGYSAQQPLPSIPPVTIDSLTGDICMTPTVNITTVMAILVQEWRDIGGVPTMIGSVLRDMQLTVLTCTNHIPVLSGINLNATQYNPNDTIYNLNISEGNPVSLQIFSFDSDIPKDSLTMTYYDSIPGSSWSVSGNGSSAPVGTFTWTPDSSDMSNNPHCFLVNIADDNCPYLGYQRFMYCLEVIPDTSTIGNVENSKGGKIHLYPCPVKESFIIDLGGFYQDVSVEIYNTIGELVSREPNCDFRKKEIKNKLLEGLYIVKISCAAFSENAMIIMQ